MWTVTSAAVPGAGCIGSTVTLTMGLRPPPWQPSHPSTASPMFLAQARIGARDTPSRIAIPRLQKPGERPRAVRGVAERVGLHVHRIEARYQEVVVGDGPAVAEEAACLQPAARP